MEAPYCVPSAMNPRSHRVFTRVHSEPIGAMARSLDCLVRPSRPDVQYTCAILLPGRGWRTSTRLWQQIVRCSHPRPLKAPAFGASVCNETALLRPGTSIPKPLCSPRTIRSGRRARQLLLTQRDNLRFDELRSLLVRSSPCVGL